jgi:signal transduction histidine kinase/CheY-like chemotaxis protein
MEKNILEFWRMLPAQSDPNDPSSCGKPAVGMDQEHGAVCVMPPSAAERAHALGLRSYMIIPLKARGRTLGCLCLISIRDREYSDFDIPLGEELAQRAGLALDNSRLYNDARVAREAAEAANAAKDRFLAMLSHELRTPLSPVLHSVAYIEGESEIAPRVREALGTIRRNVQLEARLIDDLLDLARIRNGKLQLQREVVDAHELIHRTVEICHSQIVAHRLEVRFDFRAERSKLHADPARIQQIFWNLITNALKFSPAGGALVIATSNEDGVFRAEVTDQGRGILADKLERIFDAFEQADGTRSSGLGLGLAICRALVHLHGGTITAVSEGTGRGASFIISLPAASEAELKAPEEPASPSAVPAPALRLLVVEDHLDTATALRKLLVRRGYEVRSAETVAQALEIAEDFDFDVLVSDIGLPDGTGVDLMVRLSATEGRHAFRGIALSGFGMQEDLERSSAAGFSHHLTKPVDFPLLDRTLVRIGQELERGS